MRSNDTSRYLNEEKNHCNPQGLEAPAQKRDRLKLISPLIKTMRSTASVSDEARKARGSGWFTWILYSLLYVKGDIMFVQ